MALSPSASGSSMAGRELWSWWGQHSPMDVTAQSGHPCRVETRGCACGHWGVNKRTKKHNGHGGSASSGGFWWTSGKGRERRGSQTADCRTLLCSLDCDTCSVANNRTTASIIAQPPDSYTPSGIRAAGRRAAAGAKRR
ncbi:hypothetical protein COCMIDRAFT_104179 [Bipolaris oryzae ATCC 44560]|uniref:Uncharacterized protein n=1 Tax=Bipolaris oryzae ATCC 44560 TaxID=930090 RepID=W6YXD1_COCMI|nr:uncharacterized protein COCMIDRAFT_104179 [Bipolaris oryzae ATCC 44560]EUC42183.1 hypothetical protein COCMIDRAFT_104179 [Bipolaris oryzae ATCC 44560]